MSDGPRRRKRQDTLSQLGRAPARTTTSPPAPRDDDSDRGAVRRWIHGALFDNVGLKFLSMVLAITVFLLVNTDRDREITVRVGVSYTLPDDRVLVSDRLDEVFVTIKGSWRRLRKFDARELERVNIDLRRAPSGDVPITPDMVHVPSGLAVESIQPHSVRVAWDKRVERVVEVQPQVEGTPQHGYKVADVKATPATIKVRGAEQAVDDMPPLKTQKVFVDGRAESFTAAVDAVPSGSVEVVGSAQVQVHVTIEESLVNSKMTDLKIVLRGDGVDPAKWTVDPPDIDVTLTGAQLAVEKAKTTIAPVVKLSATDSKPHEVDITVEGAPPGVGIKLSPGRVKVSPVK